MVRQEGISPVHSHSPHLGSHACNVLLALGVCRGSNLIRLPYLQTCVNTPRHGVVHLVLEVLLEPWRGGACLERHSHTLGPRGGRNEYLISSGACQESAQAKLFRFEPMRAYGSARAHQHPPASLANTRRVL
jgi:hypothetical protein